MRTVGFLLLLLLVIIAARLAGGTAGRVAAEESRKSASEDLAHFIGELEKFELASSRRQQALRDTYVSELQEGGWESLFDAGRIKQDVGLAETSRIVNRAKAALGKFEAGVLASMETSRQQINALEISDRERSTMLSSFDRGAKASHETLALEHRLILEAESVVSLLSSNTSWAVEDDRFVLQDPELRRAIGARFQEMDAIALRQQKIYEGANSDALAR
ncbi:hypothetical protein [Novilysobacter defluvii]|uniref:hypothetical protein n=1 Tax=Novilysobacter defluvii TaxID=391738 RepID=UPI0012B5C483|nr:hypothetical protein [Lysobacter defluvii]